jgi:small subunit ribosomal protein S6
MRGYEAIFIFRPSLTEEDRMKHVEKIEKIISAGGVLHESNYWGRKRFAYPIQKFIDGHFYLFVFDAESTIPHDLKRLTKITETILRSLIIVRETVYRAKEGPLPTETQTPPPKPTIIAQEEPVEVVQPPTEVEEPEKALEEIKIEDTNAE